MTLGFASGLADQARLLTFAVKAIQSLEGLSAMGGAGLISAIE